MGAFALLAVAASLALILGVTFFKSQSALERLRQECAQLQQAGMERDARIAELQTRIENQQRTVATLAQSATPLAPEPQSTPGKQSSQESPPPESAELKRQRAAAALDALKAACLEQSNRLAAARSAFYSLATRMSVPADIAGMSPAKGLEAPSLRPYWPFFEARKELDFQQTMADRLRLRTLSEELEGLQLAMDPLEALESLYAAQSAQLEAARTLYSDLAASLNVPDEIALQDPAGPAAFSNLVAYQPFFEAKREKEFLEAALERLRVRMVAEEIDAKLPKP